jgi:hypothetical protein
MGHSQLRARFEIYISCPPPDMALRPIPISGKSEDTRKQDDRRRRIHENMGSRSSAMRLVNSNRALGEHIRSLLENNLGELAINIRQRTPEDKIIQSTHVHLRAGLERYEHMLPIQYDRRDCDR